LKKIKESILFFIKAKLYDAEQYSSNAIIIVFKTVHPF